MRYANIDCPICEKPLDNGEPVVVCPECGAPYHLDCYKKDEKCIYDDLHASGKEWSAPNRQEKYDGKAPLRCSRCGTINPSDGLFCQVCGNELSGFANADTQSPEMHKQMENGAPFFAPLNPFTTPFGGVPSDEDIDGVSAKDLSIFVGANSHYFLPRFKQLSQAGGKAKTINWAAFIFTGGYFLYRKMYSKGVLLILANILLSIPYVILTMASFDASMAFSDAAVNMEWLMAVNTVTSILTWALRFFCGFYANSFYKTHAFRSIKSVKEQYTLENDAYVTALRKKGSVATELIIGLVAAYFILAFVAVIVVLTL